MMTRSPIANWQPQTEVGFQNALMLKAHAEKKRNAAQKAMQKAKQVASPLPGSVQSKALAAAHKRRLDAGRFKKVEVPLYTRSSLPTDEVWSLEMQHDEPMLRALCSQDATTDDWAFALKQAEPELRLSQSSTLYGALRDACSLLNKNPRPLWISPESNWLSMWLPTCGTIDEARQLLSANPALEQFYRLILPATWVAPRRRSGLQDGAIYRSWKQAIKSGESSKNWGCHVLIYLDRPDQRMPLYESTVARLRLNGQGVVELSRGVVFSQLVELVLHNRPTDQLLRRIPSGIAFGGPAKSHWSFRPDEKVVLDCPEKRALNKEGVRGVHLTELEQLHYQQLKQRMAAPIDLEQESCQ